MMETFGLLWLRPLWLVAIPLALLAGALLVRRAHRLGGWERVVDAPLLAQLRRMGQVVEGPRARLWLPALVLALTGLALAGPAVERRDLPAFRNLDAVVIIVDMSPSMTATGQLIDTLTTARLLGESAGSRQVGLIVYAGDAYVASALTSDAEALGGTIALLEAGVVPDPGSRPERALELAAKMLRDARIVAGDVVLISDGGGIGPAALAAARALPDAGASLSTVAVPSETSDAPALAALAATGEGVAVDLAKPFPLAEALRARPLARLADSGFSLLVLSDLGRYLLLLALIPLAFLLPRRVT